MPKKQKHYETRDQIVADIELEKSRQRDLSAKMAFEDAMADALMKSPHPGVARLTKQHRDEAVKLKAKIDRSTNIRMKKLQRTLAAFDTPPLIGEKAVVLQGAE